MENKNKNNAATTNLQNVLTEELIRTFFGILPNGEYIANFDDIEVKASVEHVDLDHVWVNILPPEAESVNKDAVVRIIAVTEPNGNLAFFLQKGRLKGMGELLNRRTIENDLFRLSELVTELVERVAIAA